MSTDSKGHIPTKFDKWLLVKYKKYPTKQDIPPVVNSIAMRRIHDRARVHGAFILMLLTGLGMFGNAMLGKIHTKKNIEELRKTRDELIQKKYG